MKRRLAFAILGSYICTTPVFAGLDPCNPNSLYCSTRIQCAYDRGNGTKEIVQVAGPDNVNLRRVMNGSVPLKINGSQESQFFSVKTEFHGSWQTTLFRYINPFFRSDIQFVYIENHATQANSIRGAWTTDYPSTIKMNCEFVPWSR